MKAQSGPSDNCSNVDTMVQWMDRLFLRARRGIPVEGIIFLYNVELHCLRLFDVDLNDD